MIFTSASRKKTILYVLFTSLIKDRVDGSEKELGYDFHASLQCNLSLVIGGCGHLRYIVICWFYAPDITALVENCYSSNMPEYNFLAMLRIFPIFGVCLCQMTPNLSRSCRFLFRRLACDEPFVKVTVKKNSK